MSGPAKRRKLLLIALGVVCVGWVGDLLLRGGRVKEAAAANDPSAGPAAVEAGAAPIEPAELIARLRGVAGGDAVRAQEAIRRNPFAFSATMEQRLQPETPDIPPPEPELDVIAAAPPPITETHRVEAIMAGTQPMAIINGVLVSEGAELDGYRVVRISATAVVLRGDEGEVRLPLPD